MRKPAAIWSAGLAASLLVLGSTGPLAGSAAAQSEGTAWLGVYTQSITSGLREGMEYDGDGVLVSRVVDGSPADRAGVRKGDIIISLSGQRVGSPTELMRAVRDHRSGQSVSLSLWRDGARRTISARLGDRPANEDEFGSPDPGDIGTPEPDAPDVPETPRAPRAPRAPRSDAFGDRDWQNGFRMLNRGRLGIQIQDLTGELGDALEVPDGKGVLIVEVMDDTPAKRAGLRAGDVIVRANDRDVDESGDLTKVLDEAGDRVTLTVVRKGARRTVVSELDRSVPRARTYRIDPSDGDRRFEIKRLGPNADQDRALREELRQLREELRVLRDKVERLERN